MGCDCYFTASAYPNKSVLIMVPSNTVQVVAMGEETKGMIPPVATSFASC